MPWFEIFYGGLALVLGASIGSFINVVVYRLPEGLSLLRPPSRCPHCFTQLRAWDNIPVLGWILLRGRCRYCRSPIHWRYPAVELLCALLFGWAYGTFGLAWMTLGAFVFLGWLLALALIDLDFMILPNPLTQWGLVSGLVFQGLGGWHRSGTLVGGAQALFAALFAAVLGLLLFDAITVVASRLLGQPAMGGGDAKLAALIGAWLGWQQMLLSAFLACLVGAVVGVGGIALGKIGRRQAIPFGPYLVLGAILALFWGEFLIQGYLQLLGF
ncbi:prepilin peptidase [Lyngbya confervoides]|uniref:Prepilin leader peptidase/N-methyltransferase n=1 Tax=Lyngbya confervoides BDU141951 TaxID=1574623 RepID=A0ABD4T4C1_9CYAN|nr:A24 family peptidase [Lyngbya confervoides]MCM1983082.1 prepilin peptidase [Lyngbya confervoides BDU141951]